MPLDPISFTLLDKRLRYRLNHLQGRNELLAKAIGWRKKNPPPTVIDTTAGLGRDALLFAALGCQVTLFERHPVVADHLEQSLQDASLEADLAPFIQRMHLIKACAIEYLNKHPQMKSDVVYCDPMFEPKKKSALVKKELQELQSVVGVDKDIDVLLSLALQRATKRVVIKRPLASPHLLREPNVIFSGRAYRFDVYSSL